MSNRAEGVRVAYPLFQAGGGGSTPTSALQLTVEWMRFTTAQELNRKWHSRLPRFGTGAIKNPDARFSCFGAEFDGLWYAAAIWSLPESRELPQDGSWYALRRLAVAPDAPDAPRNTPSRMLAVMTRILRKERPDTERLISYQDTEAHTGCIYRAAGWEMVDTTGSNTQWNQPGRRRPKSQSDAPKVRWEKVLKNP